MPGDPKTPARVRDDTLYPLLHYRWRECALRQELHPKTAYGPPGIVWSLSLHHVHKHPRDDVEAALVMVCGHGTVGCHFRLENADMEARAALVRHIRIFRPDTFAYLTAKLGSAIRADEWLRSHMTSKLEAAS